jgi:SAM-dependent methyltransferase
MLQPDAADVTEPAARPRRANVVASYDLGVERYEQLWSPVILPPAAALIPWLELGDKTTVLDVGAGTGALVDTIRSAAPGAQVIALDASMGMLRAAHLRREAPAAQADAMVLAIVDETVDAVVLAYVLFHLADPLAALKEAARVLRLGGRVATVTWASERTERAQLVWDDALAAAGVPPLPPGRVDAGLDSPEAISSLLAQAGLLPRRIWSQLLCRQWDRESFWSLRSGSGVNRRRLAQIDPEARAILLGRLRRQLGELQPKDLFWEGHVLCAVASKPDSEAGR